jgi:subtilisin family serine protease
MQRIFVGITGWRPAFVIALSVGTAMCLATAGSASDGLKMRAAILAKTHGDVSSPTALHRVVRWARMYRVDRRLSSSGAYAARRAVLGYQPGTDISELAHELGVRIVASAGTLNAVEIEATPTALAAVPATADGRVRYIEPLQKFDSDHQRNDPLTYQADPQTGQPWEWNFAHVGLDRALNITRGSSDILVGYVDSGFSNVADLNGKVAEAWYYASQSTDAADGEGHGTFVASLIAANADDSFGLSGFCGACRLVAFKDIGLSQLTVAAAISKLVAQHVRIINLSLGGASSSFLMADAVSSAINAGVLIVASSGNDSLPTVSYPAALLQPANGAVGYGLAVGASDGADNRVFFSNYGANLSLVAPGASHGVCGDGVIGALPPVASEFDGSTCLRLFADSSGNRYAYANGTSFSAPEVAGVAALVWAANPALLNYQVADIIEQSATRPAGTGWTPERGWGVLNAAAAVERASGRSSADTVTLSNVSVSGAAVPGKTMTATGSFSWGDNTPVASGTATCDAAAGTTLVTTVTFSAGVVSCSWQLPSTAAGQAGTGHLAATDSSGNQASAGFSFRVGKPAVAKPKATSKPKPKAKPKPKPKRKRK